MMFEMIKFCKKAIFRFIKNISKKEYAESQSALSAIFELFSDSETRASSVSVSRTG